MNNEKRKDATPHGGTSSNYLIVIRLCPERITGAKVRKFSHMCKFYCTFFSFFSEKRPKRTTNNRESLQNNHDRFVGALGKIPLHPVFGRFERFSVPECVIYHPERFCALKSNE